MKFKVTFKCPDVYREATLEQAAFMANLTGLPTNSDEYQMAIDGEVRKADKLAEKFVRWGEYVTVEFDTDAMTATVVQQ